MKNLTIITSFNRKNNLIKLIKSLEKQNTDILIFDDCSNFTIKKPYFIQFEYNFGKEYNWKKWNLIIKDLKFRKKYDNYLFIPDDVRISDTFVEDSVNAWNNLDDKRKICLNLITDKRINNPQWTCHKPIKKGQYINTQWCDLSFICSYNFLLCWKMVHLSLKRWEENPKAGSGVGSYLSKHLHWLGYKMYHYETSLAHHLPLESEMNKEERKINPIKSL